MKRFLCLFLALMLPALALASTTFDGTVMAGDAVSITAPFGGTVSNFPLRQGSRIQLGDAVATIQTTKVYASADGVIAGVFAQEGDSVDNVVSRYGAVMYIVPQNRYSVTADIEKAYNSSETKYVHIGETVYMTCTSDGAHTATGLVTAASGTSYTVESTSGELMLGEMVYLYRSADRTAKSRIGRGSVSRTKEISVSGSGSILKLHVKDGDTVSRGDLLFETVTGSLDGLYAAGNDILSAVSGVVATVNTSVGSNVNKGDTLLTVYTMDTLQVEISVNEYDLPAIAEGDAVALTFNNDESKSMQTMGTVEMISHLSSGTGSEASYPAYISFMPDEEVRIGMTVVITTLDGEAEAAETEEESAGEAEEQNE